MVRCPLAAGTESGYNTWWWSAGQMGDAAEVLGALYEKLAAVAAKAGQPSLLDESFGLSVKVGDCFTICHSPSSSPASAAALCMHVVPSKQSACMRCKVIVAAYPGYDLCWLDSNNLLRAQGHIGGCAGCRRMCTAKAVARTLISIATCSTSSMSSLQA